MENTHQYDELLIRYLLREANAEEEAWVVQWINADERNRRYFEALQQTWRLAGLKKDLDQVDAEGEWLRFQQSVDSSAAKVVPIGESPVYENEPEEGSGKRPLVYRLLVAAAVAASVLLILGLGFGWFSGKQTDAPAVAGAGAGAKKDSLVASVHYERNTSGKAKRFTLGDGTVVTLANKSELAYPEPFAANKRDLSLTGKATFKVAKDKARPFTVYSGDISTTALGTEFEVTAIKKAGRITVRLYEGKVVVKGVDTLQHKLNKDYYLAPGQQLVYKTGSSTATVSRFGQPAGAGAPREGEAVAGDNPSVPTNEKGTWYMFNNQPLEVVFQQLESMYGVAIVYAKKDVRNLYFIGRYNSKTDSVETILKDIATLNGLKVSREHNKFTITKQ